MHSQNQQISAVEKQLRALELRKSGAAYATIAEVLGYRSPSGAHAAVKSALKKTLQEPADELRQLELARLDAMLAALWPKANAGDVKAVHGVLKVLERRAKLLGLDAPTETDITSGGRPLAIVLDR